MPANWYIPSSATATIVVGLAKGEIGDFRVTPAAEEGDIVGSTTDPVAIGVRNVGSLAGAISLRIRDLDGAIIWTGNITLAIDEFDWIYPAINYPMPAHDLSLRAEAYHDGVVDSFMDKTVVLIIRVDTDITLTLTPEAVEPGASYHYIGVLTRIDTGAGLAGMAIIARREGVEVGNGTTGADGSYDIVAAAPTAQGSYNCQAVFPGVVPFAASSAQVGLGVTMEILKPILAVVPAAFGVALVMLSTWK
ncbi:unnamed protein product [marine sediment metagenome]|uniref:Uncharacterized protein n=1 Tax=marine sediment metagenome TaxID=412755 RepID=X1MIE5_9ZZZZ